MAVETLATKYRPKVFGEVVAQDSIKTILLNQVMGKTFKNAYLFTGSAGTGKTTCARIFANEINEHQGNPIEIDGASNNGVDNIRDIIEDAKKKSLESKYKIYIIDECVTGDTEILTLSGWKRMDSISRDEKVAQYTDDGRIEFVTIDDYIVQDYVGDMYKVSFRNGKKSVLMSPNHVQPVRMKSSKKIVEHYIKDCKFSQSNEIIVGGIGTGNNELLTSLERLYIACQADGYCNNRLWELHLSLQNKINRAIDLLDDCGINYKIYGKNPCSIRFYYNFPKSKKFIDYFKVDMGIERAKDFIDEILLWDGSTKSGYPGYYSCTDKDNVDFVSAILVQCGYSGNQNLIHYENPNHKDLYEINWYNTDARPSTAVSKEKIGGYSGKIYCVKVPSHKIVLRAEGFTFISGNCHMISTAGWNAMLKLIEEPPANTIFIFCTTDPQKIPQTILSRVQRYDFTRISNDQISKRLCYICECEDKNVPFEVIQYITKIADGGMRNAITMLDKVIASENYSMENAIKVLGKANYEIMFQLVDVLEIKSMSFIPIIEQLEQEGKDLRQFMEQFLYFIIDLAKFKLIKNFDFINIPENDRYKNIMNDGIDGEFLENILKWCIDIQSELRYSSNPKYTIEGSLMQWVLENR